ncbi:uncharacterized protein BP01DRAFT_13933 [Aspergillus saccharolyticus JOP 1030-1]|uniref:Uncharacterized protein n=1 Tax=Aspergillus saccharolyticus JOP 1030-1 TaxID=1450539 RepID=A0A319AF31_9EURO|nr:hypothetical protein BP01DRAFT_13933 [Aspergillus saccharolyticus JOP 1030-1]PYH50088.1 hypothetical protein BP01DRAFT_13933 [Aspergillus saccharolyticus JOP 1030-1]
MATLRSGRLIMEETDGTTSGWWQYTPFDPVNKARVFLQLRPRNFHHRSFISSAELTPAQPMWILCATPFLKRPMQLAVHMIRIVLQMLACKKPLGHVQVRSPESCLQPSACSSGMCVRNTGLGPGDTFLPLRPGLHSLLWLCKSWMSWSDDHGPPQAVIYKLSSSAPSICQ